MNETEYVSQMLTVLKRFAQHHDVHVWFVAHPRQMRDWKGAVHAWPLPKDFLDELIDDVARMIILLTT